jgi:N6-L-threonylcarbamoyladenine synthase
MQAHILAHFIEGQKNHSIPEFPLLCLTVSGGHTQLVRVDAPLTMKVIGETIDDAAGEAFDKAAKVLGLPYPGGPLVDKLARTGNPNRFSFTTPRIPGFDFSFSGLKTSLLYFLRDNSVEKPDFAQENLADICASYQRTIVDYLLNRMADAARSQGISHLCIAGGVSANSELREKFVAMCEREGWHAHIPEFVYCTDNAAMVAMAGHFKLLGGITSELNEKPMARMSVELE